nr:MAG TPA: hypothetical protein [Caudoviricetes sp.]
MLRYGSSYFTSLSIKKAALMPLIVSVYSIVAIASSIPH